MLLIKCEIQFQNIDARFTEEPKITPIGILPDELEDFVFV
jgi:hypothetical protein